MVQRPLDDKGVQGDKKRAEDKEQIVDPGHLQMKDVHRQQYAAEHHEDRADIPEPELFLEHDGADHRRHEDIGFEKDRAAARARIPQAEERGEIEKKA